MDLIHRLGASLSWSLTAYRKSANCCLDQVMRLTPDQSRRSRLRRAQTGIRVLRTERVIVAGIGGIASR